MRKKWGIAPYRRSKSTPTQDDGKSFRWKDRSRTNSGKSSLVRRAHNEVALDLAPPAEWARDAEGASPALM